MFPEKENVADRYDHKSFDLAHKINTFVNVVSQENNINGNAITIYQKGVLGLEF